MFRQIATAAILLAASAVTFTPAEAATIQVMISGLAFSPAEITAQIGDTIEWSNKDFVAHTATARDKTFDVLIPAGGKGSLVLKAAGAADYYCRFHPVMKGKIQISGQ